MPTADLWASGLHVNQLQINSSDLNWWNKAGMGIQLHQQLCVPLQLGAQKETTDAAQK